MLLVDAANVVGSRPTGWWRDRAGAARQFVDRLRSAVGDGRIDPPVTVVLEGGARQGVPPGAAGGVTVVHAARSGDDALVEAVAKASGERIVLVTADRGLRRRVQPFGAEVVGPSWLLDRLG